MLWTVALSEWWHHLFNSSSLLLLRFCHKQMGGGGGSCAWNGPQARFLTLLCRRVKYSVIVWRWSQKVQVKMVWTFPEGWRWSVAQRMLKMKPSGKRKRAEPRRGFTNVVQEKMKMSGLTQGWRNADDLLWSSKKKVNDIFSLFLSPSAVLTETLTLNPRIFLSSHSSHVLFCPAHWFLLEQTFYPPETKLKPSMEMCDKDLRAFRQQLRFKMLKRFNFCVHMQLEKTRAYI